MGLKIIVRCDIYPTEDILKIKDAILSIFPDCRFEMREREAVCESSSIKRFAEILKEERIRDTARSYFLANIKNDTLEFGINKQVATLGKISFSVGDVPLGDIRIKVISDDIHSLIDAIAPSTKNQ